MTHTSRIRYGDPPTAHSASGAASGPVKVSYFDPATGRPIQRKAKVKAARKREGSITAMHPRRVTVTVGGKTYDSMKSAALALGCSHTRLTVARREGRTELDGVPLSFGEEGGGQ